MYDNQDEGSEDRSFPFLPNRQGEYDRLYCSHLMAKYAWNGNFGAPVHDLLRSDSGVKVLDVGCGSGFWTLEMATEYPLAKFYGLDSIPTFPDSVLPRNVEFIEANLLDGALPFKDAEFDYVFLREIMFSFLPSDFKSIITKEILRIVKPGGYIEFSESELESYEKGKAFKRFTDEGVEPWFRFVNVDYKFIHHFKEFLISINQLKNVTEEKVKIPLGCKNSNDFAAEFASENTLYFARSMADRLIPIMKLTRKEYFNLIKEVEDEFKDENDTCYFWYRRFIATKV